jgi:hypothetical protein
MCTTSQLRPHVVGWLRARTRVGGVFLEEAVGAVCPPPQYAPERRTRYVQVKQALRSVSGACTCSLRAVVKQDEGGVGRVEPGRRRKRDEMAVRKKDRGKHAYSPLST